MRLRVEPDGVVRCLYSEAIDLSCFGDASIHRASTVEPDEHGQWWADLAPVQGPRLGPFVLRSQALDAEQAWLEARWFPAASTPSARP
jgi:hypothetical protein